MFEYGGNNHFNKRFDFFEWSAPYYENPKEVYIALNKLNLKGKNLLTINAIGAVGDVGNTGGTSLYQTITNAGIDLGDNWWEEYPQMNKVRIPWTFELCEPIQFVFDDHTSLEILPIEDGGARIGFNSIPVGMVNGLNDSGIKAGEFFRELKGKKLRNIELKIKRNEVETVDDFWLRQEKPYKEIRTEYVIQLDFEYPYTLEIAQDWQSWYEVRCKGNWDQERVPYERKTIACKTSEIPTIVNGRDGGGTFWIIGISSKEERISDIPNLDCFGMSIDDMIVSEYLSEFLYKYFDPSIQERNEYDESGFDWYGGNLYTFETMRKMLDDIYATIDLLQTDYNNPQLDKIKSHWPIYKYTEKSHDELSDEELNELRKNHVPIAISFYERFCLRMENMLKIPGNDLMSFAGP